MLEEALMALFSQGVTPQEDPLRRRRGLAGDNGGYNSVAGPEMSLGRLLPFLLGTPYPNMTGFPSGMDFSKLSMDVRNGIAGANVAPGSPSGKAVNQPSITALTPDGGYTQTNGGGDASHASPSGKKGLMDLINVSGPRR